MYPTREKAEEILKEFFNKTKQNVFLIELIKIYFDKGCLHEIEKIMNDKKENKVLKDIFGKRQMIKRYSLAGEGIFNLLYIDNYIYEFRFKEIRLYHD